MKIMNILIIAGIPLFSHAMHQKKLTFDDLADRVFAGRAEVPARYVDDARSHVRSTFARLADEDRAKLGELEEAYRTNIAGPFDELYDGALDHAARESRETKKNNRGTCIIVYALLIPATAAIAAMATYFNVSLGLEFRHCGSSNSSHTS